MIDTFKIPEVVFALAILIGIYFTVDMLIANGIAQQYCKDMNLTLDDHAPLRYDEGLFVAPRPYNVPCINKTYVN